MRNPLLLVTQRNRLWIAVAVGLAAVLLYEIVGAASETLSPTTMPLLAVDHAIPLIPWTFWIYATVYFIYAAACLLLDDLPTLRVFLTGYLIATLLSSVIFLSFPTTLPRDLFPVATCDDLSSRALSWFRTVGCATLSALAFRRHRPGMFALFVLWAAGISFATMGTKQHYFIDVLGGATLGVASYWLAERLVSRATA